MNLRRYPAYKPSGIGWLGDVPAHWHVQRLRYVAEVNPSKSSARELDDALPVSFLPMESIGDNGVLDLGDERPVGELLAGYTYLREGDVAVAKITPCFENGKGAFMRGLVNGVGFGTTELIVARPISSVLAGSFLHYVFSSGQFRNLGAAEMYGAGGQKRVPESCVRNFAMAWPPLPEQAAIAAFLDYETAKIDALVAEQRRLMELLKEKRQAVVSHAVTKGLDPDVPMRPSGMEWLSEVPAHWEVVRLKQVAEIRAGVAKGKDNGDCELVSVPYLRVANVQDGYLDLQEVATIEVPLKDLERLALHPGDVLMNEGGDFDKLGRGHVWHGQIAPCITQNHVFAVRPQRIPSDWLDLITGAAYAQFYFMSRAKQSTNLASISSSNLMELPVLLPPLHEQGEIVAAVEEARRSLDSLAAEADLAVALLKERRMALISAAVSGQFDVRTLVDPAAA